MSMVMVSVTALASTFLSYLTRLTAAAGVPSSLIVSSVLRILSWVSLLMMSPSMVTPWSSAIIEPESADGVLLELVTTSSVSPLMVTLTRLKVPLSPVEA